MKKSPASTSTLLRLLCIAAVMGPGFGLRCDRCTDYPPGSPVFRANRACTPGSCGKNWEQIMECGQFGQCGKTMRLNQDGVYSPTVYECLEHSQNCDGSKEFHQYCACNSGDFCASGSKFKRDCSKEGGNGSDNPTGPKNRGAAPKSSWTLYKYFGVVVVGILQTGGLGLSKPTVNL